MLRDRDGKALKHNFVHPDDLVSAMLLALVTPEVRQKCGRTGGLWRVGGIPIADARLAIYRYC
jgi:hypothetical protein